MKPQCKTSADCLRELARVMDQFGFTDSYLAITSHFVKYDGAERGWSMHPGRELPYFATPSRFSFAIAEVEGKPVFIGDKLYEKSHFACVKLTATGLDSVGNIICYSEKGECSIRFVADELSWNPPKPTTVMVELPVKIAEFHANFELQGWHRDELFETQAACKTALEKLK